MPDDRKRLKPTEAENQNSIAADNSITISSAKPNSRSANRAQQLSHVIALFLLELYLIKGIVNHGGSYVYGRLMYACTAALVVAVTRVLPRRWAIEEIGTRLWFRTDSDRMTPMQMLKTSMQYLVLSIGLALLAYPIMASLLLASHMILLYAMIVLQLGAALCFGLAVYLLIRALWRYLRAMVRV